MNGKDVEGSSRDVLGGPEENFEKFESIYFFSRPRCESGTPSYK
jgi:hypothetical protein